jgi:hypothetical protein
VFPGVPFSCSLVWGPREHQGSNFCGVPSRSKENVLGKDHLSQRNQYKNIVSTYKMKINNNRGTSTCICCLDYENVMGI